MDAGVTRSTEREVFVGLGSNLGDRQAHLAAAIDAMGSIDGVRVVAESPIYETDPVGPPPQGRYLNAVVQLATERTPKALLQVLLEIEAQRGRVRGTERNASRTLDLDILLFGVQVIEQPGLSVPHPRLHARPFVLEPLCAIAARLVHPILGETIGDLAARVRDPVAVRIYRP